MATVKVTNVAHSEAKHMLVLIQEISDQFHKLGQSGTQMSNPTNWDGPLAQKFRSEVWPQATKDLTNMKTSLQDLQSKVQRILSNISAAGGDGHN